MSDRFQPNPLQLAHYSEVIGATLPGSAEHLAGHVTIFHTKGTGRPTTSLEVTARAWLRQDLIRNRLREIATYARAMKPYMGRSRDDILLASIASLRRVSDDAFRWMDQWETLCSLSKLISIPQESWTEATEKLATLDENLG